MSTKYLFPLLGITALALSTPSFADIIGTSSGAFSSLSGCTSSGAHADCKIVGGGTELEWGSTSSRSPLKNPSTLTADAETIHSPGTASSVTLAELTWFNSPTTVSQTPLAFGVDYKLTISFTAPGTSTTSETFDLVIGNPPIIGDFVGGFTLPDLSALTFNLPGETVSDLHYAATGGSSLVDVLGDDVWYNPEGNTGSLAIVADFTDPPAPVPEPASLALVASGLLGLALLRLGPAAVRARR